MIKYFLLSLALICVLVVGIFGFRGDKFHKRPIILFPDMDRQDKVLQQEPSDFFSNGMAARKPVAGTVPHGLEATLFPVEFGEGRSGYYYTGAIDDYYANGLPEELELNAGNIEPFLRRGHERYQIYCAVCHGASGDGLGVTSAYGIPGIANLHVFPRSDYPDGRLYSVITNGKGNMSGYKANIPVRDRWAIVAYVRALQSAQKASAPAPAPADPESTDPEPVEGPADPEPVEPVPADPEPVEPVPVEPVPVDPERVEIEPVEPESTDPESTDPESTDPEPAEGPVEIEPVDSVSN